MVWSYLALINIVLQCRIHRNVIAFMVILTVVAFMLGSCVKMTCEMIAAVMLRVGRAYRSNLFHRGKHNP